jgi:ribosomal protein L24
MGVNKRAIRAMFPKDKWKILRGDKVVITAGKDKGQTGIVSKVIRDEKIPRVIVEGRNLVSTSFRHVLLADMVQKSTIADTSASRHLAWVCAEQASYQANRGQPGRPHFHRGVIPSPFKQQLSVIFQHSASGKACFACLYPQY